MKKLLGIVVLGLLLSSNVYSKTIVVKANPEKGFNFPYLLKTSKKTSDAKYLIVESNNTGNAKSIEDMTSNAKKSLGWVFGSKIAKKLNYPLLMPVFPFATKEIENELNPKLKWYYYFPQLDSDTIKIDTDKYKRIAVI